MIRGTWPPWVRGVWPPSLRGVWPPRVRGVWRWLRTATGDDAYERYVEHRTRKHPGEPVLTREAFYDESQRRKWGGISRCC